jgi:hypothetical protein
MAEIVYILCSITSTLCAAMLYRKYKKMPMPLLLWSCLCFVGMAINNILLFIDMVLLPESIDLSVLRTVPAVIGVAFLIYGFVWDQA